MAGIDLARATAKLEIWLDAEDELAVKQSYTLPDGRSLTKADLKTVGDRIEYWQGWVDRLDKTTARRLQPRLRRAIPRGL